MEYFRNIPLILRCYVGWYFLFNFFVLCIILHYLVFHFSCKYIFLFRLTQKWLNMLTSIVLTSCSSGVSRNLFPVTIPALLMSIVTCNQETTYVLYVLFSNTVRFWEFSTRYGSTVHSFSLSAAFEKYLAVARAHMSPTYCN